MTPEQARVQVEEATAMRKQWGKQYSHTDAPTDFLDAVVMEVDRLKSLARDPEADQKAVDAMAKLIAERDKQHAEIVLLKRQLGAAKSRETQLRKQLAELTKQMEI